MKVWVHGYQLTPKVPTGPHRRGALLKVEWALGQIGYSDLHPWPEFGEAPLDVHLEQLGAMKFTRLTEVSLEFNYIDREFRLLKRNAFLGLIIPRSHKLVVDMTSGVSGQDLAAWEKQGYSHVKVKMGKNLAVETQALLELAYSSHLSWRLDFNGLLSAEEFTEWWKKLDADVKRRIDFVEDPIREGKIKIEGPWANDWFKNEQARVRIIKPAREGIDDIGVFNRIVFTHGLDHSFGQACAAWTAGKFYSAHPKKVEVCGLNGGDVYQPDDFSRKWENASPRMKPTTGLGFGFDEILESLKWERLF
jgi:O-succinylbenzoate synthase